MIILGISCYYHDAAACILKDGVVHAAAAEERFTRKKHDNVFPQHAITFCLDSLRIAINEVDIICFYEKPIIKFERVLYQHFAYFPKSYQTFLNTTASWFGQKLQLKKTLEQKFGYVGKISFIEHHLAHAASAYYISGFKDATIVTIDGVGEWATTTIGHAKRNKISIDKEILFPHSLGLLYSTLTTYLGFSANDAEYKVMGLAAYGDPAPFRKHFNQLIKICRDGSYTLNMKYFDFAWAEHMPSSEMSKLFGYPARQPESEMSQPYENIAATLQEKLEQVTFKLLNTAYKNYKSANLCLAGGVALNSVMNGKILKNTPFKKLCIPPDPGDAGGAMGAALWTWHNYLQSEQSKKTKSKNNHLSSFSPYLGPAYAWYIVEKALEKYQLKYVLFTQKEKLLDKTANLLTQQKIIGWFQGRMEWGPRALGNRSILASAHKSEMKDIINSRVKYRELFRPFAPVILEEFASKYFHIDRPLPTCAKWMLMVYPFREKMKQKLPAVVHVDGSGRLQTVAKKDNPLYYELVQAYFRKTKLPSIINTSFNVRGEPIVCTPEDAIKCFLRTDIDYLVIDQFLVTKDHKGRELE